MGGNAIRLVVVAGAVFFSAASADQGGGTQQPGDPCSDSEECVEGSVCFNDFCVGDGVLRFSLSWTTDSDFDLHVMTPNGNHIYWQMTAADGGMLDVDQCAAGCTVGSHVENIVFTEGAPLGQYQIWVENFSGHSAGSFNIEFSGTGLSVPGDSGDLPATAGAQSTIFLVDFN